MSNFSGAHLQQTESFLYTLKVEAKRISCTMQGIMSEERDSRGFHGSPSEKGARGLQNTEQNQKYEYNKDDSFFHKTVLY